jgi:hypothetical protein
MISQATGTGHLVEQAHQDADQLLVRGFPAMSIGQHRHGHAVHEEGKDCGSVTRSHSHTATQPHARACSLHAGTLGGATRGVQGDRKQGIQGNLGGH